MFLGAYIDVQSETLVTPLHAATINRYLKATLLDNKERHADTGAITRQLKCVALLVAKGADMTLKDSNGKTALELVPKDDSELLSCFQNQGDLHVRNKVISWRSNIIRCKAYKRLEDIESLQNKRMLIERELEDER